MSPDEHALLTELVVHIAIRLNELCHLDEKTGRPVSVKDATAIKNSVVYHHFMTDFENACSMLVQLGVARRVGPNPSPARIGDSSSHCIRIKFDIPGMRKRLAHLPSSPPPISKVLGSFVQLTSAYGLRSQPVPTRRKPFAVAKDFEQVFELLHRCGYVKLIDSEAQWTNMMAPAMRAIHAWD
jgi:hypothetical protein